MVVILSILILVVVGLTGCSSTISAFGRLLDEAVSASADDAVEQEMAEADMAGPRPAGGLAVPIGQRAFGSMLALQNVMLFNVAYMQVFFLGGYDPGFDDFREGQGITWEISGDQSGSEDSFLAERALLRRNADGSSWWYLGYRAGSDNMEYEVLMDREYVPLELVWNDPDSRENLRYTFETDEAEAEASGAEDSVVYSDEFASDNSLGRERVTVGSGTYTSEHLSYVVTDDGSGGRLQYDWWLVDDVPGGLVKYEYRQVSGRDESLLSGELVAVKDGYTTRFGAY